MAVKLAVHKQNIISLVFGSIYKEILFLGISSIQEYQFLVLVGLRRLDSFTVIIYAEILSVSILEKRELHSPLAEFLITEHSVLDEELDIVPFLLVLLSLLLKDFF